MKETIIELAQNQEYGDWFSHKCPLCPDGRKRPILSIKRESDKIVSKCWSDKCPAHNLKTWYLNGNPQQIRDMIMREEKLSNKSRKYGLPGGISYNIPPEWCEYLDKYEIGSYLIRKYRIGYCEEHTYKDRTIFTKRLVIPTPSGFVARSQSDVPKWKNFCDYDFSSLGVACTDNICLVEDPISMIRVGEIMPAICLLGTSIKEKQFIQCMKYKEILIWLDGDKAGVKGALNIKKQLDPYVRCRIIQTKEDPKTYTDHEIKRRLYNE